MLISALTLGAIPLASSRGPVAVTRRRVNGQWIEVQRYNRPEAGPPREKMTADLPPIPG